MSLKISARTSKSKSNKAARAAKETKMAASTASPKRYIVFTQTGTFSAHYLAVRVEEELRLTEAEKAGLLEVFDVTPSGARRKNLFFKPWISNEAHSKLKGYVFYWLCDGKACTLAEAKAAVDEVLAKPAPKAKSTKARPAAKTVNVAKRAVIEF